VKQRSTVKQGLKKLQFGEPTKNSKNQKAMSIDQPVKEVITEYEFPVSPLTEVSPSLSNNTLTSVATKTVLPQQTSKTLPGMKVF